MQIAGYLKTSLIEWPGLVSSVIFTSGCNFRCPFCHNPELVEKRAKPVLKEEEEIISDLKARKKWADAVVITGGEPTLQKDLPEFLGKLKKIGYQTMVHTNGTNPKMLKELIKGSLVNYLCMDIKGDFENYGKYTGVSFGFEPVKESLALIFQSNLPFELRSTLVPTLHDREGLEKTAKWVKSAGNFKEDNFSWYLQQFRPTSCLDPEFTKIKPFSKEEMENFLGVFKKHFSKVFLRGVY